MTFYSVIFYLIAAFIVAMTAIAITRKNTVHAVLFLVLSFFGSAMLFYLLGAPLLAAFEVIIYAGAIMILFLFIIMMLRIDDTHHAVLPMKRLIPALGIVAGFLIMGLLMFFHAGKTLSKAMPAAVADPAQFGVFLFQRHWLEIEVVSLLLLVALVAALYIGKAALKPSGPDSGEKP